MPTETLRINITADNRSAIAGVTQVKNTVDGLTESIKVYQDKAFSEKDVAKLKVYNREIQALQAQLKQTTNVGKVGFDEMGVAIKGGNNGLSKAFTGLRQIAYIIPGLGMAGIFNLAFEGIEKLASGLDDAKNKAKEFANEYVKAMESAEAGTQKEVASIQSLVAVASNESLSRKDRTAALKELNKEYPGYFSNTNIDITNTEKLRMITDKLSAALIRKGNAEALSGLIGKENAKIWEAQHQSLDQQIDKVSTATKIWDYFKGAVLNSDPIFAANDAQVNILTDSFKEKNDVVKNATDNIKSLTQELNKNTLDQIQNNDFVDLSTKKIKEKSKAYDELAAYLKQYYKMVALGANQVVQTTRSKETEKSMHDVAPPKTLKENGVFGADFAQIADQRKQALDDFNKSLARSASLANVGANAFASMFDAMAKGESIGDAIANVFKDLVKQLAMMVAKAITFAVILNVITGGQYSIGKIFTGALGGNFTGKGYAQGGLSTGPKSGHMELLHGNEWVLRPEQLNGALMAAKSMGSIEGGGSGTQRIEVVGKIAGQDIWLSKQRTDYNRGLTT